MEACSLKEQQEILHIKVEERTRETGRTKKTAFHSGKRALSSKPTIETAKRKITKQKDN